MPSQRQVEVNTDTTMIGSALRVAKPATARSSVPHFRQFRGFRCAGASFATTEAGVWSVLVNAPIRPFDGHACRFASISAPVFLATPSGEGQGRDPA